MQQNLFLKNCISGSQLSQWFAERNSVFFIRQNKNPAQKNSNFTEVNMNVSSVWCNMCVQLTLIIILHCAAVCNATRLGLHIMLDVSRLAKLDKEVCTASTRGTLIHTSLKVSAQTKNKNLKEVIHDSFQCGYIFLQLNLNLRHPTRSTSNTYKCCNMCVIHF